MIGIDKCVIVGGGAAAVSAAASLRTAGFQGTVTLVCAEDVLPYERPPLSKDFLANSCTAEELQLRQAGWYEENDVDLRLGTRIVGIDVDRHVLQTDDGDRLKYDRALIATGGHARRLLGIDSSRILYLRSQQDAEALGKRIRHEEPLVVLGGGFIGCEVAATARKLGVEVTILERAATPLQRVLGPSVAEVIADIHKDNGVLLRTSESVQKVTETDDAIVVTTDHGSLECSTLVAAIGLQPTVDFVEDTAIQIDQSNGGIAVDRYCRTSVPDVFAAGDVASHDHPRYGKRLRVEHHDNAVRQGAVAARNMLGAEEVYDDVHWFWSDQYDHNLQSVGRMEGCDEVVVRGSIDDRRFSVFGLSSGCVRGVFALDRGADVAAGKKLIQTGVVVTTDQIADTSTKVGRLATPGAAR